MESLRITVACFVGAVLGVVVSYLVHPSMWWIGLLAGAAAGYIAYDAREFFRGVLHALRRAVGQMPELAEASQTPLGRRRVFELGAFFVAAYGMLRIMPAPLVATHPIAGWFILTIAVIVGACLGSCAFLILGISLGMMIRGERCSLIGTDYDFEIFMSDGAREQSGNYRDFFRWLMTGWLLSPFWIIGFASRWTLEGLVRLVMLVVRCIAWLLVRA